MRKVIVAGFVISPSCCHYDFNLMKSLWRQVESEVIMTYGVGMTSDSRATFTLRAPRSLLDRLKAMADDRSHSMNTEIIHRLEESVYLSDAAHALEGEELTDLERAVIQRLRDIDESTRQSLLILLNKLDTKTKADR